MIQYYMQNFQIKFFFTTKKDGNLAFHVGDNKNKVLHNHQQLAQKHNYNYKKLIYMQQIHSDIVTIVNKKGFDTPPKCDALITNSYDTPLMVMVADCTPILLYDSHRGVVAAIHAGRAGAFNNIIKKTITKMQLHFNSNIADIKVAIGPSIGVCCYEVGEEISMEAKKLKLSYAIKTQNKKYYLDIGKIIDAQLKENGIKKQNITKSELCNCCENRSYYSYRAAKKTGRFAGVIYLESLNIKNDID